MWMYILLGVILGWIAEWLFVTFFLGGSKSDCSSVKAELEQKKAEISRLQGKLSEAKSAAEKVADTAASSVSKTTSTASKAASSATDKVASAAKKTGGVVSKAAPATASTSAKAASAAKSAGSTASSTAKSAGNTASKAAPSTKAVAPKKAAPKKATAKKAPTKTVNSRAKMDGDDFTKLSGIGPSMSATLKSLGIDTFAKLAATDDDILIAMLEESGARLNNNKDIMDTWNEQATLASKGDFAALKKMQEVLKK